jgi:hypothetical protein
LKTPFSGQLANTETLGKKMKLLWIFYFVIVASCSTVHAADHIEPYSAFGPQVEAYELIGMEWWQWQHYHCCSPYTEYPIKVVIYWDQTLEQTKKNFPVDRQRKLDFRYVDYFSAINYLEKTIKKLQEWELNPDPDQPEGVFSDSIQNLQQTLNRIRKAHQQTRQSGGANPLPAPNKH